MLEVFHPLPPAWKRGAGRPHDINFVLELGEQPKLFFVRTPQLERLPEQRGNHLGEIKSRHAPY